MAHIQGTYARIFKKQGNFQVAQKSYNTYGNFHQKILIPLKHLGQIYFLQHHSQKAKKFLQQTLKYHLKSLGQHTSKQAITLKFFGGVYLQMVQKSYLSTSPKRRNDEKQFDLNNYSQGELLFYLGIEYKKQMNNKKLKNICKKVQEQESQTTEKKTNNTQMPPINQNKLTNFFRLILQTNDFYVTNLFIFKAQLKNSDNIVLLVRQLIIHYYILKMQKQKRVESILFEEFPILKDASVLENIKCKGQAKADFVCIKNGCQHYPFMCVHKQCKCKHDHQKCTKILFQDFLLKIEQNVEYLDMLLYTHDQKLDAFSQKITHEITKLKNCFRKEVKDKCRQLSFTTEQRELLYKIQAVKVQHLKGADFYKIYQQCQEKENGKNSFDFDEEIECMQTAWKQLSDQLMYQLEEIRYLWKANQKQKAFYASGQLIESKIATTTKQSRIIKDFFNRKILKFELLYRASENQFKIEEFHERCDGISNTITLVLTEFNKKVGGFTPLQWINHKGAYLPDSSESSFIFSLTNNEKLLQKNFKSGIRNNQHYGPIFGNQQYWDFYISQSANKNQNSHLSFNYGYLRQNNNVKNDHDYTSLGGNPNNSGTFRVKEWEVWRIVFSQ